MSAATSSPPRGAIIAGEPPERVQLWANRAERMAARWSIYGRRPKPVVLFRGRKRWAEILMRLHRVGMRETHYRPEPFDVWEICRRARHDPGSGAIEFVGWRRGALARGEQPTLFVIVNEERPVPLDSFARGDGMSDWPKDLECVPPWARFVDKNGEPIRPEKDLVVGLAVKLAQTAGDGSKKP